MISSKEYLHHTRGAVIQLFQAIHEEQSTRRSLIEELKPIEAQAYTDALEIQVHSACDRIGLWDARTKASHLSEYIKLSHLTLGALCSSVLQIVKQGISICIPATERLSKGRLIGSQELSKVIWYARNQSIHFEEKKLNSKCILCFETLDNDFELSPKLSYNLNKNLSFEILKLLKWKSYSNYFSDVSVMLDS